MPRVASTSCACRALRRDRPLGLSPPRPAPSSGDSPGLGSRSGAARGAGATRVTSAAPETCVADSGASHWPRKRSLGGGVTRRGTLVCAAVIAAAVAASVVKAAPSAPPLVQVTPHELRLRQPLAGL